MTHKALQFDPSLPLQSQFPAVPVICLCSSLTFPKHWRLFWLSPVYPISSFSGMSFSHLPFLTYFSCHRSFCGPGAVLDGEFKDERGKWLPVRHSQSRCVCWALSHSTTPPVSMPLPTFPSHPYQWDGQRHVRGHVLPFLGRVCFPDGKEQTQCMYSPRSRGLVWCGSCSRHPAARR